VSRQKSLTTRKQDREVADKLYKLREPSHGKNIQRGDFADEEDLRREVELFLPEKPASEITTPWMPSIAEEDMTDLISPSCRFARFLRNGLVLLSGND